MQAQSRVGSLDLHMHLCFLIIIDMLYIKFSINLKTKENQMKLFISTLLLTLTMALSACVSEEGARKHAERGYALASEVGMMPGMMWKAVVYHTDTKEPMELGHFESRSKCHEATQAHMTGHEPPEKGHLASACVVVKANN